MPLLNLNRLVVLKKGHFFAIIIIIHLLSSYKSPQQPDPETCNYNVKADQSKSYHISFFLIDGEKTTKDLDELVNYFYKKKQIIKNLGDKAYLLDNNRRVSVVKDKHLFHIEINVNKKPDRQALICLAQAVIDKIEG